MLQGGVLASRRSNPRKDAECSRAYMARLNGDTWRDIAEEINLTERGARQRMRQWCERHGHGWPIQAAQHGE